MCNKKLRRKKIYCWILRNNYMKGGRWGRGRAVAMCMWLKHEYYLWRYYKVSYWRLIVLWYFLFYRMISPKALLWRKLILAMEWCSSSMIRIQTWFIWQERLVCSIKIWLCLCVCILSTFKTVPLLVIVREKDLYSSLSWSTSNKTYLAFFFLVCYSHFER